MKKLISVLALIGVAASAQAALINGDFSSTTLGDSNLSAGSTNAATIGDTTTDFDAGWYRLRDKSAWGIAGGIATRDDTLDAGYKAIAQIFSDASLTGTGGTVSFDYDLTAAATTNNNAGMEYMLWGYKYIGGGTASTTVFDAENDLDMNNSNTLMTDGANWTVTNLSSNSWVNANTAGTYTDNTIDFGTGYDYFGITIGIKSLDPAGTATLDNVAVSASVPEPSTYALILGGLVVGFAALRRRKRA